MKFTELGVAGAYLVEQERVGDSRGYFARAWCQEEFRQIGLSPVFKQTNMSGTARRGTIRGLHYQVPPHSEAKFVRCVRGAMYDVIVDLRPESPTYQRWGAVELNADSGNALYLPAGVATGMQTLTEDVVMLYSVTAHYAPEAERGFRYDDPAFEIAWPLPPTVVSEKDLSWAAYEPSVEMRGLFEM
jgi:dTDP-4-dehydrorhamnose 3,5-epimerase